jgi:hypothetical protein
MPCAYAIVAIKRSALQILRPPRQLTTNNDLHSLQVLPPGFLEQSIGQLAAHTTAHARSQTTMNFLSAVVLLAGLALTGTARTKQMS